MPATISGRAWKFGDNVSGDNGIIEFSMIRDFTKPFDEASLGRICFAKIDPDFPDKVRPGDLVVGGRNFAHHSHPQVAVAIKAAGIAAVIVESTETGFLRKALNYGLPLLLCPGIAGIVDTGDELAIDLASGAIQNLTTGARLDARPYSERMLAIIRHGGLIPYLKGVHADDRVGGPAEAAG